MMVIFTSRSEKKSRAVVRQILDSFADRIGNDTWQTIITKEGLQTVKSLLRQNATKSTAVSCHWLRSRNHSDLVWIVGSRERFNSEGVVPVNWTARDIMHSEWEGSWQYMPLLKALTATAALFHDWGKASKLFQGKLLAKKANKEADPWRHEWITCKLLEAVVQCSKDTKADQSWITRLLDGQIKERQLIKCLKEQIEAGTMNVLRAELPPLMQVLMWLILSHHRLPLPLTENLQVDRKFNADEPMTFAEMMRRITADWSYHNPENQQLKACCSFPKGLLLQDEEWQKQLSLWLPRLEEELPTLLNLWQQPADSTALRPLLLYAREAVMLSDHYISSLAVFDQPIGETKDYLWANTGKIEKDGQSEQIPRQLLRTHLIRTASQAVKIVRKLPVFASEMERAEDIRFPRTSAASKFAWQTKAVEAIRLHRKGRDKNQAWFIVNMASTGRGKTLVNAKIMRAISADEKSLRYILALGLRTLTLQTGTEYRERIGLGTDELAVLIGSKAVEKLYDKDTSGKAMNKDWEVDLAGGDEQQGESAEELFSGEIVFEDGFSREQMDFLSIFLNGKKNKAAKKNQALLFRPVLVATIDHLMGATETKRGGHHLLPILRMLSSDLVIDEIDDFSPRDLIAIARLIHLAGMLGRSVVISSATIPPDLAGCLYRAYQDGICCYNRFFIQPKMVNTAWIDEFRTQTEEMNLSDENQYNLLHQGFIEKRVRSLRKEAVHRRAWIVSCQTAKDASTTAEKRDCYYQVIRQTVERMHGYHHVIDVRTGKKVSFGVIRVANIMPCVELSRYLLDCEWEEDMQPVLMCYHSQQVLLLRHMQEHYLDQVLQGKLRGRERVDFSDPLVRHHIDGSQATDIVFLVIATPVEEIGRDHDFDWAIIEPSSYRSIIQLAGRILRHRWDIVPTEPNIAILQYNIRGLEGDTVAFTRPGFESGEWPLESHDMMELVDEKSLAGRVDAIPRIDRPKVLQPEMHLIDLEHAVMQAMGQMDIKGPATVGGWQRTFWWLTALPQVLNTFRASTGKDVRLCYEYQDGNLRFCEEIDDEYKCVEEEYGIQVEEEEPSHVERLWLTRDYIEALQQYEEPNDSDDENENLRRTSHRYGELMLTNYSEDDRYSYSNQFGLAKLRRR